MSYIIEQEHWQFKAMQIQCSMLQFTIVLQYYLGGMDGSYMRPLLNLDVQQPIWVGSLQLKHFVHAKTYMMGKYQRRDRWTKRRI